MPDMYRHRILASDDEGTAVPIQHQYSQIYSHACQGTYINSHHFILVIDTLRLPS